MSRQKSYQKNWHLSKKSVQTTGIARCNCKKVTKKLDLPITEALCFSVASSALALPSEISMASASEVRPMLNNFDFSLFWRLSRCWRIRLCEAAWRAETQASLSASVYVASCCWWPRVWTTRMVLFESKHKIQSAEFPAPNSNLTNNYSREGMQSSC